MDDREFKEQVQAIHGSPMLDRLFAILDEKYVTAWRNGPAVNEREDAHRMLRAVDALKHEITYIANDSRISSFNRRLKNDNI